MQKVWCGVGVRKWHKGDLEKIFRPCRRVCRVRKMRGSKGRGNGERGGEREYILLLI